MADAPIGISFIPSADQAANGPQQGNLEGDLSQAFKILSLRLPRILGARAPASSTLLNGPGSAGLPNGGNPYAAVIQALLGTKTGTGTVPAPNVRYNDPPAVGTPVDRGGVYTPPSAPRPSTPRGRDFPTPGGRFGGDTGGTLPGTWPPGGVGGYQPGQYSPGDYTPLAGSPPPIPRDWLMGQRNGY
jgi:hypothetical protein